MALASVFFGCFTEKSTANKVVGQGDEECHLGIAHEDEQKPASLPAEAASGVTKSKTKKASKPPIPITYFPAGSRFSVL